MVRRCREICLIRLGALFEKFEELSERLLQCMLCSCVPGLDVEGVVGRVVCVTGEGAISVFLSKSEGAQQHDG